jgi:lysine-N-methylase
MLAKARQAKISEADVKAFEAFAKPFEYEFENLAFYYIYRYFCNAVADEDITFCINSLLLAYLSIFTLECAEYKQNGELDFDRRVRIFQLYSKEVEHSFENIERLENCFNLL